LFAQLFLPKFVLASLYCYMYIGDLSCL